MNNKILKTGWPLAGAAVTSMLLLTAVLYRQTIMYLGDIWSDIHIGEYAHGFLVLAISLYLINYNRDKLAKINPCPAYVALPLLFFSALLWMVAVMVDVEMLQSFALLFIVLSVVWVITGHQTMKILAFPILFIGFGIPVWFPLSPLLQNFTADVVFWVTRLVGVPAFRQENLIIIPGGTFSIEETCSGLRYLLAALTLGSLYAYLNYVRLTTRVAVVAVVAAAAILANIIRVFTVVYLGYATQMQHPWVADHLMLGWYLFGALIVLLLFIDVRFYRPVKAGVIDAGAKDAGSPCSKSGQQFLLVSVLCALLLAIGPAIIYQQKNQQQAPVSDVRFDLPAGGWLLQSESSNDWMPQYNGAISTKAEYQVRGDDVSVFIAYYPYQKQGAEAINDLNRISINKVWRTQLSSPRNRSLPAHDVLEQVIKNSQNKERLVWYWYNIGGQVTTNKYQAKLLQLLGLLTAKPQAYMVAVSMAVESDIEASRKAMLKIMTELEIPLTKLHVTE
ncbi:MAG: EpsI family protein [Gammaproteobacteria bacterium]|nr:EpsI family protein [Gammaproteobacteria bacterium]